MRRGNSFWTHRPSRSHALVLSALVALIGVALSLVAARVSPLVVRSHLRVEAGGLDPLYLTRLQEDPARALLTTRRENSTWSRDQSSQAGDPYWVRRYADPARPGLPDRFLLSSRSRGAHLLIPLGALDLERALAAPALAGDAPPKEPLVDGPPALGPADPALRSKLVRLYWNRSFAGIYLQLRLRERTEITQGPEAGEFISYDLVIVRDGALCTTDFLLQPNGELYRSLLADGLMPAGAFRRNPAAGDESVFLIGEDSPGTAVPLFSPVSLSDELRLCWGDELPCVLDDRWREDMAPPFELAEPSARLRAKVAENGRLHLLSRLEGEDERDALELSLARFLRPADS
jgi:hypothetical protein